MADTPTSSEHAQEGSREPRRYSGKVTAVIIVAIVLVFVVLNLFSGRLIPEPDQPRSTPTIVHTTP